MHRYYDPDTGRYITPDPIGLTGGINLFVYTENDPLNLIDPFGLKTIVFMGYTKTPVPGTYHQFVLLEDTITSKRFATRGGPEVDSLFGSGINSTSSSSGGSVSASVGCSEFGGFGFGQITTVARPYDNNFVDTPNALFFEYLGVINRDFPNSVSNAIEFSKITNSNAIPYLFQNSNSYATTFVESLTGHRPEPINPWRTPGFSLGKPSSKLRYTPSPYIK